VRHVVWTHEGCLDGATVGLLARKAWPEAEVRYVEPARVDQALLGTFAPGEAGQVTLVDVAPSPEALDAVPSQVQVRVLDHHETALRLVGRPGVTVDQGRCGSYLLWQELLSQGHHLEAYEPLVRWVDDRDRWVKQEPVADELALLYDVLGRSWYHLRFDEPPPPQGSPWTAQERAILSNLEDRAQRRRTKVLERAVELTDPQGYRVRAALIQGDASDTGHLLAEGVDYALMLNPGTGAVSLRGNGRVNLAELAARYGGGGHANAAGFVPRDLPQLYVRLFEAILQGATPGEEVPAPGSGGREGG
jgi:hypothetical protein